MKKNNFKKPRNSILAVLLCLSMGVATAQIFVGSGATLHYSGGSFASGQITNGGGTVSISAALPHNETHFVHGPVTYANASTLAVSLESGATVRMPSFTTTSAGATVAYNEMPGIASGTVPAGTTLADRGVYAFTGNVSAATATPATATTYPGATGTVITQVYATSVTGPWTTTITPGTTKFMTFVKQSTLGINDAALTQFALYPNPVKAHSSSINFNLPTGVQQLNITMYDLAGKPVAQYHNVPVQAGTNSISKPQVAQGLYLMQFSFNNGEQQTVKKVIIE